MVSKGGKYFIYNESFPKNSEECILCGVNRGKYYVGPSVVKLEEIKSCFNRVELKNDNIIN